METLKLSDESLLAFFDSHPSFRDRLASIVGALGNSDGDLGEADAAEEHLAEEMRFLGREALQGWGEGTERDVCGQAGMHLIGKKFLPAHETERVNDFDTAGGGYLRLDVTAQVAGPGSCDPEFRDESVGPAGQGL
jgi:hypothetical protein